MLEFTKWACATFHGWRVSGVPEDANLSNSERLMIADRFDGHVVLIDIGDPTTEQEVREFMGWVDA